MTFLTVPLQQPIYSTWSRRLNEAFQNYVLKHFRSFVRVELTSLKILPEETLCTQAEVTRRWEKLHNEDRHYHGKSYLSNTWFNRLSRPVRNLCSLQKETQSLRKCYPRFQEFMKHLCDSVRPTNLSTLSAACRVFMFVQICLHTHT